MHVYIVWILFAILALCRAVAAGDAAAAEVGLTDPASIFRQVLFDNGTIGLFLAYMLHRENKRDKADALNAEAEKKRRREKEEKEEERRHEWIGLIRANTEVTTQNTATLAQLCSEVEKTRSAGYQVRDIVLKQTDGMWEPEVKGNTRIMPRQ